MKFTFDPVDLAPLVRQVVAEVLDKHQANDARLGPDRLAYTTPEAAALIGVPPHVIRDCRLRGELTGSRVGKRILITRKSLLEFLASKEGC